MKEKALIHNNTFLFIKKDMNIGGIETFIIRLVRWLCKENYRVIYIRPKGTEVDSSFKDTIYSDKVEVFDVDFDDLNWIQKLDISFSCESKVLGYAFYTYHFIFLEEIKRKYLDSTLSFSTYYWVPNFKDNLLEDNYPKLLKPLMRILGKKLFRKMEHNNNIFYVNPSHSSSITSSYCYDILDNGLKYTVGTSKFARPFNAQERINCYNRDVFRIISVGRFSFPHKGYIIGLIRSFAKLKFKYPHIYLELIGYGPQEDVVKEELNRLGENIRSSITVLGKVSYDELPNYFRNANVNIGVASTMSDGSLQGVVSLPVRHYTYNCETYGFLPFSKEMSTNVEKGKPIEIYLEKILTMNLEEYLNVCLESYSTYAVSPEKVENNIRLQFEQENVDPKIVVTSKTFFYFTNLNFYIGRKLRKLRKFKNKK